MPKDSIERLGEFGLIDRLSGSLGLRAGTRLGIGDDCAVLEGLAQPLVTADALVEGIHFRLDWTSPFLLGRKAMSVNYSDIAAMGGRPVAAFVCLALPKGTPSDWVGELYRGMESVAEEAQFSLAGGDMVGSPGAIMISVTLVGDTLPGGPLLRSGARAGDILVVTGQLGDSAAGLQMLLHKVPVGQISEGELLLDRHLNPAVRGKFVVELLKNCSEAAHAGLDLSDGLAGDCRHLARRSGVRAVLEAERVPLSEGCRQLAKHLNASALDWGLCGGEDYELLLAVDPGYVNAVAASADRCNLKVTIIGRCEERQGTHGAVEILLEGKPYDLAGGFTHF